MNYFDPRRNWIDGRPCWADTTYPMPRLMFEPVDGFFCNAVISFKGYWRIRSIHISDIKDIFLQYQSAPEEFMLKFFSLSISGEFQTTAKPEAIKRRF